MYFPYYPDKYKTVYYYREMKEHSLSSFYYLYMKYYEDGRKLGNILTGLVIVTSIVIGLIARAFLTWFTKNNWEVNRDISLNTLIYAFSFGSFLYNYRVIRVLHKNHEIGHFNEGSDPSYFDLFISKLGSMTVLSRFFELYTPFIIAFIVPNIFIKILLGLAFVVFVISYKLKNNFVENQKSSIIKNNIIPNLIMIVLGVILSIQSIVSIKVYNNVIFLLIAFIFGILKYLLSFNTSEFFATQKKAALDKSSAIDIYPLEKIFHISIKREKKDIPKPPAKPLTEEERKKAEREAARKRLAREREIDRGIEAYKEKQRAWQEARYKAWDEMHARKKLEEKALSQASLSEQEVILKKELETKQSEVKVDKQYQNDRASIRRY